MCGTFDGFSSSHRRLPAGPDQHRPGQGLLREPAWQCTGGPGSERLEAVVALADGLHPTAGPDFWSVLDARTQMWKVYSMRYFGREAASRGVQHRPLWPEAHLTGRLLAQVTHDGTPAVLIRKARNHEGVVFTATPEMGRLHEAIRSQERRRLAKTAISRL